ncbi:hypothetical protein F441_19579 [Phytophthora nicotianae CJ01A1]|uniref:Retrovirus-related Pol polyprotein from transposon TNT 1-94-like beta-barrel domain-containing protein n=1 Tax=Phytophthora nicotianae CJ01A1 TaxID=1317063 RepID=W2VYU5_PHYNI|nr:hypothetical protein F441_19579 [Phytophthora nicotianae CJ01A1]
MPKSWKDGLRVWRGVCKYNPYEELKMSSDTKVREIQGQERYSLAKGTPESQDTKDERYDPYRRKDALIAVVSEVQTVTSAVSLQAEANTDLGTSWTIDSRCSSYVTQHAEWFKPKTAASGGITVGGKSQIPIEAVGMVQILICDSKWTEWTLVLHNGHLAPKL